MAGISTWSAKTLMWGYVGLMALLGVAFYAVPSGDVPIWAAIGILSTGAVLLGIRRNRPRHAWPWVWIAIGIVTFTLGDTIYNIMATVGDRPNPFPGWPDGLYIITFAFLIGGLLGLSRAGAASVDRTVALDALIFTAGVGLLWWLFLIGPRLTDTSHTLAERLISIAYPVGDVLLLTVAGRLVTVVRPKPAVLLLCVGAAGTLTSDIIYGYAQLHGVWSPGGPVDLGWMIFYATWGAAALHPSMAQLTEPRVVAPREVGPRHQVAYAVLLLVPLLVFVTQAGSHPLAVGVFVMITSLLILMRLYAAINNYRRYQIRGRGMRAVNAALLSATDSDAVGDALRLAVHELLPAGTPFRTHLALNDGSDLFQVAPGRSRVAYTRTLPPGIAERMGDYELVLICPLAVAADRPSGDPHIGVLLIAADEVWLGYLKLPMELAASQAALTIERVELTHSAFHDALTGLANRGLFTERIGQALTKARADGAVAGVLFLDLDDFKVVND
jgi:hypothetical protein